MCLLNFAVPTPPRSSEFSRIVKGGRGDPSRHTCSEQEALSKIKIKKHIVREVFFHFFLSEMKFLCGVQVFGLVVSVLVLLDGRFLYESSFISWLSVRAILRGGAGLPPSPSACSCSRFLAAFCKT